MIHTVQLIFLCLVLSVNLVAAKEVSLPAVDAQNLKQSEIKKGAPLKYAITTQIDHIYQTKQGTSQVKWQQNADGLMEYSLKLRADNATSLNVGMKDFFLPPSAELWVYNDDKSVIRGPYTDRYNPKTGYFWVGDVPGDHINLTFSVKPQEQKYLSFYIDQVSRGFYAYWKSPAENGLKSGSCNIDVACPEGDDWWPEISSVGQYSFQIPNDAGYVCTGQLINNTAEDGTPYFLTASHCGYTGSSANDKDSVAASVNIIWNYESQTCRAPGSGSSGTPISKGTFNQRQSGATFVANNETSDFALLLLNQTPDAAFNIQYSGWDRSDTAFDGAVAIHHPAGHAKRISFDNDLLTITGYLQDNGGGNSHLRVIDWDKGTTESGSSGSGLWNSDYRLVGQLHGGYAACGNDESDWYGRFYYSWDKGTSAQTRLKDWLDPLDTRQMTLDTSGRCDAPTVTINPPDTIKVGESAEFSAVVSGGSGGYSYYWDLNGDGRANGHGATISTRYAQSYVGNVTLTVKDDSGCQAVDSRAVIVEAPDIQVHNTSQLTQICGNNDHSVDPGERWRTQLTVNNNGNQAATGAFLMLDARPQYIKDNFGNQAATCQTEFIDISSTGTFYEWMKGPVSNATADDEGYAVIPLDQPFKHYDQTVSTLVASTNGYLNTDANANGIDWDNDCPLPAVPDKDSTGGRIAVMHDDLNSSQFYHQHFSVCPRAAESGAQLACDVFLWKGAYFYGSGAIDSMDVQAILYPATSQWVFQHRGPGANGATSTVGIQNDAATDALTFACNSPDSLSEEQAVCVFHKDHGDISRDSLITLETPVIALNELGINDSSNVQVDFTVAEAAACGSAVSINHTASVYDRGFNIGQPEVIQFEVGENGQCQVYEPCEVNDDNTVMPKSGMWWNPDRFGHAIDFHVMGNDRLIYTINSANPDGSPVWYVADSDESAYDLFYNDLGQISFPGGFENGQRDIAVSGWSHTYFLDPEHALQYREIDGHAFAEKFEYLYLDTQTIGNQEFGRYYAPTEPGWGQTVIDKGQNRVVFSYLYDNDGNPYWTYASGANDNTPLTAYQLYTFCDHCPWVEPIMEPAGEVHIELNGQSEGIVHYYDIEYPANAHQPGVIWQRIDLPIINLFP